MSTVSLNAVKTYCKIDEEIDDALVSSLIEAAEAYLDHAGVTPETAPTALYALAVKGMVLHWYDHREAGETAAPDFAPGVRKVINQLKHTSGLLPSMYCS